jgi:hypothetical protein
MNSENLTLNEEQIECLFKFTKDHFVEYYDLQIELVDHLASDIEAVWKETPALSYENARAKAFKKFGIYGFGNVIAKRERAMCKRYFKYFLKELKQWFTLPKFMATLALFAMFYVVFSINYNFYFTYLFYGILIIWSFYKMFHLSRSFKKRTKISNKKWMLEHFIFKQAGGIGLVIISQIINILNHSENLMETKYLVVIMAILFTFLFLLNYISLELLPNKAEILLKETYPEYRLEV